VRHRSYRLECTPATFQPRDAETRLRVSAASPREFVRCKRLWTEVGAGFWTERSRWSDARWRAHVGKPDVSFWIARLSAREAGCFELTRSARGAKIEGFGLLPGFRGRGLGRALLTAATLRAFAKGAPKVWLHTATDDHPHALPNYLSGGYRIVRTRKLRRPMRT
jgi:ribosomal protein S18 acetylase RimI-like enzyme